HTAPAASASTGFYKDMGTGEVKTVDLDGSAVTAGKIDTGAVNGAKVRDESLSTDDLAGANVEGFVSLGSVLNGRCSNFIFNIAGAEVGDVPVVAAKAAM